MSGARRKTWSSQQVRDLGVSTDVKTAASVLGVSNYQAYELIRRGEFPVPVLRLGRRKIVIPVAGLLEALGIEAADAPTASTAA